MSGRRINVRAVVVREDKILAVKHIDEKGVEAEYWAVPGGGLDPMENLVDGVKREIFEELGVKATVDRLLAMQQFVSRRDDHDEELEMFFLVEDSSEYDHVDLASTSHGAIELGRVEFVDPKKVSILPRFLSEIDIADCAAHEREVVVYNYISSRTE